MGVDSAANVSGAGTGALSLANAMYWDWNSGYIMLKAEGNSPQSTTGTFAIHPGGFSGEYNIVTVKSTDLGSEKLIIEKDKTPTVNMTVNPAMLWDSMPGLSYNSVVHQPGPTAKQMAKDFYKSVVFAGLIIE